MARSVLIGGISASAGANISLKGLIPAPIYKIVSATILAGRSVNEAGSATYDILSATSVTATKVDDYTITLSAAITTKDLLLLKYIAESEVVAP
jgi:hypothetical protein